jgi:uncharacterized protein (DUF1697 family)
VSVKADKNPTVLFAFLRAVNLGKHNKVPMAGLMDLLKANSFPEAKYMLASGNVVFLERAPDTEELRTRLVDLVEVEFGVRTAVVLRTPEDLRDHLASDPFTRTGMSRVYVSMWDGKPDPEGLESLEGEDFSPDRLHLVEGAAIMGYAAGSHDSKLLNALIEKRLKVRATARNVNTFRRLLERFAPWAAVDSS